MGTILIRAATLMIAMAIILAGCVLVVGTERRVVGDAGTSDLERCQADCASELAICKAQCDKGQECKACTTASQSCNAACVQNHSGQ